jgi:hypothetical protein
MAWHHRRIVGVRVALLRASAISGTALFVGACLGTLALSGRGSGGLGTARPAIDLYGYGARPRDFFRHLGGSASEIRVYVGWLTIALAVLWLATTARGWKGRSKTLQLATVSLTAMTLVAAAFSLSNPLPILGHQAHPMPSLILWKLSAEFRVPARLIAVVMTGLIPLAALGLHSLCVAARRYVRPRAASLALAAAICVAAGVVSYHDLVVSVIDTRVRRPPVYDSLPATPAGVLAEYPLAEPDDWHNSEYIFWQRIHGRRLLNGAGGGTPADEVSRALVDPASRGTAASLALLGVSAIITRPHTYDYRNDLDIDTPAPKTWGPGYRLVARFPRGVRLWRVTARPAPAVVSYATTDFGLPAPQEHDFVMRSLTGTTGRIDLYAKRPGLWRLRLRTVSPHGRLALRLSGAASSRTIDLGARTAVSVPVLLPRGHSQLTVRIPQRASGDVALSNAWFVAAARSDRSGALRPRLVSPRPGF